MYSLRRLPPRLDSAPPCVSRRCDCGHLTIRWSRLRPARPGREPCRTGRAARGRSGWSLPPLFRVEPPPAVQGIERTTRYGVAGGSPGLNMARG
jgi:hypothetical protein